MEFLLYTKKGFYNYNFNKLISYEKLKETPPHLLYNVVLGFTPSVSGIGVLYKLSIRWNILILIMYVHVYTIHCFEKT